MNSPNTYVGPISQVRIARAARAVQQAITDLFGGLEGMEGRNGAGFYAAARSGVPVYYAFHGVALEEKALKYNELAHEKARRVARTSQISNQNRSRDSANEALGQYPGAVMGEKYAWSISGYKSHVDELGSIAWAYLTNDVADQIAAMRLAEGNDHIDRLPEFLGAALKYFKRE